MRHGKKFNHLSRKKGHRKALLKNMSIALIEHKRIRTTVAKAKALRQYIEPLLTRARKAASEEKIKDATHHRRVIFSHLQNKEAVKTLFGEIAMKIADRPGGYVRILRTGFRQNDAADMCIIELVDFNTDALETKTTKKKRTRRSRKKKSADTTTTATETVVEDNEEAVNTDDTTKEEE
ncbi:MULTISPECIES: 50S ribosomal protein L17 [unclassified Aureispira]|uniref:50S ribosomal protein L17 n=1 Tax=unclassified Aureispira TaxID=2649989 RepID=UPI00069690DB|nr:50S ribosomal protein L17 [Aureispira sp. CCB-QB1]WMX14799.1 50S ribosomal protein L17 [Aureispira sp. CCB-E]